MFDSLCVYYTTYVRHGKETQQLVIDTNGWGSLQITQSVVE